MKNLFTLLLLALWAAPGSAQTTNHAIGYGFTSSAQVVCALGNGRFVAAGVGTPAPGALFADTVFALIFDTNGQIEQRILVPAPISEVHYVTGIHTLPDGGFVLSLSSTLCDVVSDQNNLFCYTPDGHLRWSKDGLYSFAGSPLTVLPDGMVVGAYSNKLKAFDYTNGNLLWEAQLEGSAEIYSLAFVPGTEDFVAVGFPHVQYWQQIGAPGSHNYSMIYAENLPSGAYLPKVLVHDGQAYGLDLSFHRLIRFDDTSYEILADLPNTPVDFTASDSSFWFVGKSNSYTSILETNAEGQPLSTWATTDPWLSANAIASDGEQIALAGVCGSGPASDMFVLDYKGIHAWLSNIDINDPSSGSEQHNASLKSVEQNSPVHVEATDLPLPPSPVYQLSGGNFRVEVTNTGNTLLQEVDVMISFGYNVFWDICFYKPAIRKHYDNLMVQPGQSVWLEFGDIEASGQVDVPVEFCFWTASPNEKPDAYREDDVFCHTIALGNGGPVELHTAVRLFPNPADGAGVYAECDAPGADYRLFDTAGREVRRGQWPAGISQIRIPTDDLSTGLYIFQTGNWHGKLVVNR
ncbi:MAG: hypothetical protein JNL02_09515 [Saprospiraceae bacterium]|nr:hypothetical protein [Saprospiraceae bacterium]